MVQRFSVEQEFVCCSQKKNQLVSAVGNHDKKFADVDMTTSFSIHNKSEKVQKYKISIE
jgi:hypothetical protein